MQESRRQAGWTGAAANRLGNVCRVPSTGRTTPRKHGMSGKDGFCLLIVQGYLMGPRRAQLTLNMAIMLAHRAGSRILNTHVSCQQRPGALGAEAPRHS